MKTWGEIKQAILNKIFLEEDEARQQGYLAKFQQLANEGLNIIANSVRPKISTFVVTVVEKEEGKEKADSEYYVGELIEMPEDFLSFSDHINYKDGYEDPEIVYITDTAIALPEAGVYIIHYNGLWDRIDATDASGDVKINIPANILNCIPSYVASQVLSQDDIQRSTVLKNEFELMLARLDTNVFYESNHFKSSGGWY
jgi:hypothetical protein